MMKKIFAVVISFLCFIQMFGQTPPPPGYYFWYENGNGSFINTSALSIPILSNFQAALPATGGATYNGIIRTTPFYHPPPPPSSISIMNRNPTNFLTPTASTPPLSFTTMPAGQILHTHMNAPDFLSKDTVMLALNYIANNGEYKKLGFFYNKTTNSPSPFIPITDPISQATLLLGITGGSSFMPIKDVRMHNGEVASVATPTLMASAGAGYNNGLIFTVNSSSVIPKNIFISLLTYPNLTTTGTENFKLVFLSDRDEPLIAKENLIKNNTKIKSHDPNFETVEPSCVEAKSMAGTKAHYKVHFQNTGEGNAGKVKTKTLLPAGYTIADIDGGLSSILWNISGVGVHSTYYNCDMRASAGNTLELHFTPNTSTSAMLVLSGTAGLTNPMNDPTTQGEFEFDLVLKTPVVIPIDLKSKTEIIFDENLFVATEDAVLKIMECCSCAKLPNQDGVPSNCKWCRRSKFLRWLFCKDC